MTLDDFKASFADEIAKVTPLSQDDIEKAAEILHSQNATEEQIAAQVERLTANLGRKRLFYGVRKVTTVNSSIQIMYVWEEDLDKLYETMKDAKLDVKKPGTTMPWFTLTLE